MPSDWLRGLELLALILCAWSVATPTWVWWNRSIYRRRHRRVVPLRVAVDFECDHLGREIVASPSLESAPGRIVVMVDDDRKHYLTASEVTTDAGERAGPGSPSAARGESP